MSNQLTTRPRMHVEAIAKAYPAAWKQIDEVRAERGIGVPDWPEWCFAPMGAWYSIVSEGLGKSELDFESFRDVELFAALGAWRCTQGIYRFDPVIFDAIIETPISGDIPCDVIYRLPEWCVYIETPGMYWCDHKLFRFFAHLDKSANTGRHDLRFLFDTDNGLSPFLLHMGQWSLKESVKRMYSHATKHSGVAFDQVLPQALEIASEIAPFLSLLLYLCSVNSEIASVGSRLPANPTSKRTKKGLRLFPADKPTVWDVGVRMGAALRRATQASETHGETGSHAKSRTHVRRSHWHGFWSGPRNSPEERKFSLKWLPPIPVNVSDDAPIIPTIKPVN
jgi:hypothetical protein